MIHLDAEVRSGRIDASAARRTWVVDQVELPVAEGEPVAAESGDVGPDEVGQAEHVAVEGDQLVEAAVAGGDRHVLDTGHPHASCSMNSSRMLPGASTNAMRRR